MKPRAVEQSSYEIIPLFENKVEPGMLQSSIPKNGPYMTAK